MSKFTPWPWIAQPDPFGALSDWMVGTPGGKPDEIAVCEEDNARLIAAAPDLFNALTVLVEVCEWRGIPCDAARAALAKARGEA